MTLDQMKLYLRIDGTDEDETINALMIAARNYIVRATGKAYVVDDEIWNHAIKLLVAHWFENRGVETIGTVVARFSYSIDMLIQHISLCSDYVAAGETP